MTISTFAAGLKSPRSIAVDSSGNVYVVETTAPGIAKITTTGVKSAVGNGQGLTPTGVAVDSSGNVFTCFAGTRQIFKNNVPWASSPLLQDAQDLATDSSGNVYVAVAGSNCVLKISAS